MRQKSKGNEQAKLTYIETALQMEGTENKPIWWQQSENNQNG